MPLIRHGHLTAAQAARQEITWVEPTYHAVHNVLTHPAYAGAYTYGRSRQDKQVRADGTLRVRRRDAASRPVASAHQGPPRGIHQLGRPTSPTRRGSGRTSGRRRTSLEPARSARAARCCRAWRPAAPAAASSPSTTRASARPPQATTAPAPARWSRDAAPGTCAPAASRSTPPSPARSWPR